MAKLPAESLIVEPDSILIFAQSIIEIVYHVIDCHMLRSPCLHGLRYHQVCTALFYEFVNEVLLSFRRDPCCVGDFRVAIRRGEEGSFNLKQPHIHSSLRRRVIAVALL